MEISVRKRNGRLVSFDAAKIRSAIANACDVPVVVDVLTSQVVTALQNAPRVYQVEEIQDVVERETLAYLRVCDPDVLPAVQELYQGYGQYRRHRAGLRAHKRMSDLQLSVHRDKFARFINGHHETVDDVADRVAEGSVSLLSYEDKKERGLLSTLISKQLAATSGRFLQHGDKAQKTKRMEPFTNCSTSMISGLTALLGLEGSGVSSDMSDIYQKVDYRLTPKIIPVLSSNHPDFDHVTGVINQPDNVRKMMENIPECDYKWITVEDTREGLAHTLIDVTRYAYVQTILKEDPANGRNRLIELGLDPDIYIKTLVFDFSNIRKKGSPILGIQGRPASGPLPTIVALQRIEEMKALITEKWQGSFLVNHYFAASIAYGGVRRVATLTTKWWKDPTIFTYITFKRSFLNKGIHDERVQVGIQSPWYTVNMSVAVDINFWKYQDPDYAPASPADKADMLHARKVYDTVVRCQYYDATGEPGLVNVDRLSFVRLTDADFETYRAIPARDGFDTSPLQGLWEDLLRAVITAPYQAIVNPCGEAVLFLLGAYCVISDVVMYKASTLAEIEVAIRAMVRHLIRVNMMPSLYKREVDRTNRIGVSPIGWVETALKFFNYSFLDILDEEKATDFWMFIRSLNTAANEEAISYSKKLNRSIPHTVTTLKPAGSTSLWTGSTAGAHLPTVGYRHVRWLMYNLTEGKWRALAERGHKVKELTSGVCQNTVIVGFYKKGDMVDLVRDSGADPAILEITAESISLEQHLQWLQLLEKYWIDNPEYPGTGGQISYTATFSVKKETFETYKATISKYVPTIKTVSVLPVVDVHAYEYLPDDPSTPAEMDEFEKQLAEGGVQDVYLVTEPFASEFMSRSKHKRKESKPGLDYRVAPVSPISVVVPGVVTDRTPSDVPETGLIPDSMFDCGKGGCPI